MTKRKPTHRPLTLSPETIRSLSQPQLPAVGGALASVYTPHYMCATWLCGN